MASDLQIGAVPSAKQIIEDENLVRQQIPHGEDDAVHAKLLLDAFGQLRKDISAVPGKFAKTVFGDVNEDDKLQGQKSLIVAPGFDSGLKLTDDASKTASEVAQKLALFTFDDSLAKNGEQPVAKLVEQDAKVIANVDAPARFDSTLEHLQKATEAAGSEGAAAYIKLVNDQLAAMEQQGLNPLKFRINGPEQVARDCAHAKRGEYGTIWPLANGYGLGPIKY